MTTAKVHMWLLIALVTCFTDKSTNSLRLRLLGSKRIPLLLSAKLKEVEWGTVGKSDSSPDAGILYEAEQSNGIDVYNTVRNSIDQSAWLSVLRSLGKVGDNEYEESGNTNAEVAPDRVDVMIDDGDNVEVNVVGTEIRRGRNASQRRMVSEATAGFVRREVNAVLRDLRHYIETEPGATPAAASSSSSTSSKLAALAHLRHHAESTNFTDVEINFLATRMMSLCGHWRHGGDWRMCDDLLRLLRETNRPPDSYSLTAAMSVYIRHRRFDEAMVIYENMFLQDRSDQGWRGPSPVGPSEEDIRSHDNIDVDNHRSDIDGARIIRVERDPIAFMNGARAAGFCRPWETTLGILNEAARCLDIADVVPVAHTAITNLKYVDRQSGRARSAVERAYEVVAWLERLGWRPSIQTLNAVLAVACVHGTDADVHATLSSMDAEGVAPSRITYNILLNYCSTQGDVRLALDVLQMMNSGPRRVTPDAVTHNTLMKLCVHNNDLLGAKEVLRTMRAFGQRPDGHTKSLLIKLYASNNDTVAALDIVRTETDATITPYMLAVAVSACGTNWRGALELLQRGIRLKKADEAVFTAAAQCCTRQGQYTRAFRVVEAMLARGLPLNKYSFSLVVNACMAHQAILDAESGTRTDAAIRTLERYVHLAHERYPELLTNAVCQKVVNDLLLMGRPESAVDLHLGPLARTTCKPETLGLLLRDMQTLSTDGREINRHRGGKDEKNHVHESNLRGTLATRGLALIGLYCSSASTPATYAEPGNEQPNLRPRRHLLRTAHFNSVLRLLTLARMYNHTEQLFFLMSGSGSGSVGDSSSRISGSVNDRYPPTSTRGSAASTSDQSDYWTWRPGIFTIAELIRAAREAVKPQMALEVVRWGLKEGTTIPLGVISDAISFAYGEGRTDLVLEMYTLLYTAGQIQHWTSQTPNTMVPVPATPASSKATAAAADMPQYEMDLHTFSRGMAYAAITCALAEVRMILSRSEIGDGERRTQTPSVPLVLTIITGRNVAIRGPDTAAPATSGRTDKEKNSARSRTGSLDDLSVRQENDDNDKAYTLTDEIQRVLIEDFYPPISSSTVPGNPGRLYVTLTPAESTESTDKST